MFEFHFNRQPGTPVYVWLSLQVTQAIRLGDLNPGDKLPAATEVAAAITVNPNTVLKAYRMLEHEGLVQARRGLGTFVTQSLVKPGMAGRPALQSELAVWIHRAYRIGLTRSDLEALIIAELASEFDETTG
jgi:GntR family transcriptional regulator